MKYDTPLNLLVISIIFAILLLVNLVLKEKVLFIIVEFIIFLIILFFFMRSKKYKERLHSLKHIFIGLGYILGIILIITSLLSILGLLGDIIYKGQYNLIYPFLSSFFILIFGILLLYLSSILKNFLEK